MGSRREGSIGGRQAPGLRSRRAALGAGALLLALALVTACGGVSTVTGVATGGSDATPAVGSSSGSPAGAGAPVNWLPYARCMRAHGVRDFPDPNSRGQLQLHAQPGGDLDPNSPIYRAAASACAALNPVTNLSPAQRARLKAANLAYARCMRAHGIADFPDPNAEGGISLPPSAGGDLSSNSPAFQAAEAACASLGPGSATPGGS